MTIFALMAIFSIIGVQAEGKEAKIAETGTEYATFVEAVNAAESGQTVELINNAEFSGGVTIDKSITIDGGGYTLTDTGAKTESDFSVKITAGKVTFKNITLKRTATGSDKKGTGFFWLSGSGELILSGEAVMDGIEANNGAAVWAASENSNCGLTIEGNGVKITECNAYWGIIALRGKTYATIEYVEITKENDTANRNAIGMSNNTVLTMNGGLIKGYKKAGIGIGNYDGGTGVELKANIGAGVTIDSCAKGIEVNGPGTINTSATISNCTNPLVVSGKGTININGGTITGTSDVIKVSAGTVNVTGGTVNVANSAAINATGGTVNIKGGTVKGNTNLVYTNGTKAVVNVNGGSIESTDASINANNGTVNISGGTINANGSAIYMAGEATAVVEINGGTISGNNTANGIHLGKGTVNMNNGAIKNFDYGIRVLGGTLNVSGGTIESCKFGIGAEKGTVSMTGGTIRNCKSTTGTPGMGIYVNKTGTLNVNVSGGTITGCDSGINLADNNEATLAGDANVTGNTGSDIWIPADCTLYISGKFTGKVTASVSSLGSVEGNIKAASDFEGLGDLSCITNRNDGSRFAYYNKTSKAFGWTKHPEVAITSTDSGVYKTSEEGATLGAIRFITEFQAVPTDAIEYIGTYVLNAETVNTSAIPVNTKFVKFESDELTKLSADSKNAYAVDVIKIAKSNFDKPVIGISFVKLKGIDTPRYATAVVKNIDANKNLGISDGTDFAAQE